MRVAAIWSTLVYIKHCVGQQVILRPEADSSCTFKSYTALGDSYACGFGAEQRLGVCMGGKDDHFGKTCTSKECGQDIGSYSWKFAQNNQIGDFQYLACDGNDTGSVLDAQVNNPAFGNPDLVTVNMGGDNDSFFRKLVTACVFAYNTAQCEAAMTNAAASIARLPTEYGKVFAGIKARSQPSVKVVAMGYAQFWGNLDATDCISPLNQATKLQKTKMNQLAKDMNQHLKEEAENAGYLYGDVDAAFEGNRFCDDPAYNASNALFQLYWTSGNDTDGKPYLELSLFHPTLLGQLKMYDVLKSVLGCDH